MVSRKFALLVLLALALSACGGTESAIATGIAQTQQISSLETAAARPENTAAPEATEEPTAEAASQEITTSQDLNMRAGDSTAYGVMTVIPGGEVLQVIGINQAGTWYQVLYHDVVGWISVGFTTGEAPADLPVATPSAQPSSGGNSNGNSNSNNGNSNSSGGSVKDYFLSLDINDGDNKSVSGQISGDDTHRIIISVEGFGGGTNSGEVDIAFQCDTSDPTKFKLSAPGADDNVICNNNWSHQVSDSNDQVIVTVKWEGGGTVKWTLIANVSP